MRDERITVIESGQMMALQILRGTLNVNCEPFFFI